MKERNVDSKLVREAKEKAMEVKEEAKEAKEEAKEAKEEAWPSLSSLTSLATR